MIDKLDACTSCQFFYVTYDHLGARFGVCTYRKEIINLLKPDCQRIAEITLEINHKEFETEIAKQQ
jgi:hypothetical protein